MLKKIFIYFFLIYLVLQLNACYTYYNKVKTVRTTYERGLHDTIYYGVKISVIDGDTVKIDTSRIYKRRKK